MADTGKVELESTEGLNQNSVYQITVENDQKIMNLSEVLKNGLEIVIQNHKKQETELAFDMMEVAELRYGIDGGDENLAEMKKMRGSDLSVMKEHFDAMGISREELKTQVEDLRVEYSDKMEAWGLSDVSKPAVQSQDPLAFSMQDSLDVHNFMEIAEMKHKLSGSKADLNESERLKDIGFYGVLDEFQASGLTSEKLEENLDKVRSDFAKVDISKTVADMKMSDFLEFADLSIDDTAGYINALEGNNGVNGKAKYIAIEAMLATYNAQHWEMDDATDKVKSMNFMSDSQIIKTYGGERSVAEIKENINEALELACKSQQCTPKNASELTLTRSVSVDNPQAKIVDSGIAKDLFSIVSKNGGFTASVSVIDNDKPKLNKMKLS